MFWEWNGLSDKFKALWRACKQNLNENSSFLD